MKSKIISSIHLLSSSRKIKKKRHIERKFLLSLFLLFGILIPKVHSQLTIVATGGDAIGTGGKVSYSIGQIAYSYESGSNGSVAQGVQQPFEIYTLGNDDFPTITLEMIVFPNPTFNNVTLIIADYSTENLSYQLFDVNGKQIFDEKITYSETQINMLNLNSSIYFLEVTNQNKTIKTFKIIKN